LAFVPLSRLKGPDVAALALIPVAAVGWLWGMRAGLLAGLMALPLHVLLLALTMGEAWDVMIRGGLPGSVALVLIGAVVGRLRDLGERASRELGERRRAEEELRTAFDELELRIHNRTMELARANRVLETEISERVRAEEELQEAKEELEKQNAQLKALYRVGQMINSTLDLDQVLATLLEEVRRLLGVVATSVWLNDPETDELVCQQATGLQKEIVRGWRLAPGQGVAGWVAQNEESLIVTDTRADARHFDGVDQQTGLALCSALSAPLRVKGIVIGVLQVVDTTVDRFKPADRALIEPLAASAAIAIENARLYEQAQKEITERLAAEEALKRHAAELERSNRDLQDFLFVASHDLQEPLRKVHAFADRLKVKYGEALDERGRDYIERMQLATQRMQHLINDLLTYSRVTTRAQPFVSVDLGRIVREVLSDLEMQVKRVGGRVEVGDLPRIDADPIQMGQLLQNLIGNALKFHRQDQAPVVKIHAQLLKVQEGHLAGNAPGDELCQIAVEDNGIGFDEKYLDRIFQVFRRLHGRDTYEGTGVGLAICRKIVERHSGNITATSSPGQGATFVVTLPVKQPDV
jgi:signal transduction histidine kinase